MTEDEKWSTRKNLVKVSITIEKSFRVGAASKDGSEVDLRQLRASTETGGNQYPNLPASSFKGLLRTSVRRALESLSKADAYKDRFLALFGSPPPDEIAKTREGILLVTSSAENQGTLSEKTAIATSTSIRVDDRFGSVAKHAFWNYEYVALGECCGLGYDLFFQFPIDMIQAGMLLAGIRLLVFSFIGGFGARGHGMIRDVKIEPPKFVEFALRGLEELMG